MAIPEKLNNTLMERLTLMDEAVDDLNVEEDQVRIFKALKVFLLKELDLDSDGNIKKNC